MTAIVFVNRRKVGEEADVVDSKVVPSTAPYMIRLTEVPLRYINTVRMGSTTLYEQVGGTTPISDRFIVDYDNASILFSAAQAGATITITYRGTGSVVWAEDMNELDTAEFEALQTEVIDARGSKTSLDERLDIFLNHNGTPKSEWFGSAGGSIGAVQEDAVDVAVFPTKINFGNGLDVTVDVNPSGVATVVVDESELDAALIPITPDGWVTATNLQDAIGQLVRKVVLPSYTYSEIIALSNKVVGEMYNVTDFGRPGMWDGTDIIF